VSKFDAEAQQVTASEKLAQSPYMAAKARFKYSTFQTKDVDSTNEPTCPTILSLQCFHCFIICLLRHLSVLGYDCLFLCLLRHYLISAMFPLFHYLFVTPLLCSRLLLSLPLFFAPLYFLFKVSIVLVTLSAYYVTALF